MERKFKVSLTAFQWYQMLDELKRDMESMNRDNQMATILFDDISSQLPSAIKNQVEIISLDDEKLERQMARI